MGMSFGYDGATFGYENALSRLFLFGIEDVPDDEARSRLGSELIEMDSLVTPNPEDAGWSQTEVKSENWRDT